MGSAGLPAAMPAGSDATPKRHQAGRGSGNTPGQLLLLLLRCWFARAGDLQRCCSQQRQKCGMY